MLAHMFLFRCCEESYLFSTAVKRKEEEKKSTECGWEKAERTIMNFTANT